MDPTVQDAPCYPKYTSKIQSRILESKMWKYHLMGTYDNKEADIRVNENTLWFVWCFLFFKFYLFK